MAVIRISIRRMAVDTRVVISGPVDLEILFEKLGLSHDQQDVLAFNKTIEITELTGWVRDLTEEGVEPNPGPPKPKGGIQKTVVKLGKNTKNADLQAALLDAMAQHKAKTDQPPPPPPEPEPEREVSGGITLGVGTKKFWHGSYPDPDFEIPDVAIKFEQFALASILIFLVTTIMEVSLPVRLLMQAAIEFAFYKVRRGTTKRRVYTLQKTNNVVNGEDVRPDRMRHVGSIEHEDPVYQTFSVKDVLYLNFKLLDHLISFPIKQVKRPDLKASREIMVNVMPFMERAFNVTDSFDMLSKVAGRIITVNVDRALLTDSDIMTQTKVITLARFLAHQESRRMVDFYQARDQSLFTATALVIILFLSSNQIPLIQGCELLLTSALNQDLDGLWEAFRLITSTVL